MILSLETFSLILLHNLFVLDFLYSVLPSYRAHDIFKTETVFVIYSKNGKRRNDARLSDILYHRKNSCSTAEPE